MFDLTLENCLIVSKNGVQEANIAINGPSISKIGREKFQAKKTLDCRNKTVFAGLIDSHVHFRTPGDEHKEDWKTASMAALAGGVTCVLDMPNNTPPITTSLALEEKRKKVSSLAIVDFGFHFGATSQNITEIGKVKKIASVKVYTGLSTGSLLLENQSDLEKLFRFLASKKIIACVHAESQAIIEKNSKRLAKTTDPLIHSMVRSTQAEVSAVEQLIEIRKRAKNSLYFCHVSSAQALKLIAEEKEKSEQVFCEVTPHHLFLNEKSLEKLRNFGKVNPPLRKETDRLALLNGLKNGVVDVVASDHAPHTLVEKKLPYWNAPSGVPGVETMFGLLLDTAAKKNIPLQKIAEVCCENPARIFGLKNKGRISEGFDADIAITDTIKKSRISNKEMHSKCGWTPFNGWSTFGRVEKTIVRGKVVFDGKNFLAPFTGKEVF